MVVRGGASAAQDGRFIKNKMKRDMAAFTAPPEYSLTVNFKNVCIEVIEGWVMQRVTELLRGVEDEVLVGTIVESLKAKEGVKAKDLHHELVPFLANNTTLFVKELWAMLHSASNNASGVPEQLQQKHLEEQRKKSEQQALIQARIKEARKRQNAPQETGSKPPEKEYQRQPQDDRAVHRGGDHRDSHRERPPHRDRDARYDNRGDDRRGERRTHDSHARDHHHRRRERDSDRREYRGRDDRDRHTSDARKYDRRSPDDRRRREEDDCRGGRGRDHGRDHARDSRSRELRRQDTFRHTDRDGPHEDAQRDREDRGRNRRDDGSRQLRRVDAMTERSRGDEDGQRADRDGDTHGGKDGDSRAQREESPLPPPPKVNGADGAPKGDADEQDGGREGRARSVEKERAAGTSCVEEHSRDKPQRRDDDESPRSPDPRRELKRQDGFRKRDSDGSRGRRDADDDAEPGSSKREPDEEEPAREDRRRRSPDQEISGGSKRAREASGAEDRMESKDDRSDREGGHRRSSKKRKAEKSDKDRKSKKSRKHKHRDRHRDSDKEHSPGRGGSPKAQQQRSRSPDQRKDDIKIIKREEVTDLEALRQEARQAYSEKKLVRSMSMEEQG